MAEKEKDKEWKFACWVEEGKVYRGMKKERLTVR